MNVSGRDSDSAKTTRKIIKTKTRHTHKPHKLVNYVHNNCKMICFLEVKKRRAHNAAHINMYMCFIVL